MIDNNFWRNKTVLITGHTGFKGSWLSLWLHHLGAEVTGYALHPPTSLNLFQLCKLEQSVSSIIADIRDKQQLAQTIAAVDPEIIFHMAAQPLVRESYRNPVETYEINVMGTIHVLEAVRLAANKGSRIKAIINITTDKCYENKEWVWGYRETDRLGGYDPYSNSKACSELITSSYRQSFFRAQDYQFHGIGIASARAGNVIGGGDWAEDRLIPDCIRALWNKETIIIRNPKALRPWQHVLEPLSGYLVLAQKLYEFGPPFADGWNFGPNDSDAKSVEWMVQKMCEKWGRSASYVIAQGQQPHEANYLKLDCSKATTELGWYSRWNIEQAIEKIMEWTAAFMNHEDTREVCLRQIEEYSHCRIGV